MRHAASDHNRMPGVRGRSRRQAGRVISRNNNLSLVYLQGLRAGRVPTAAHGSPSTSRGYGAASVASNKSSRSSVTALVLGMYLATRRASLFEGVAAYA
jgi:hypothetical protein